MNKLLLVLSFSLFIISCANNTSVNSNVLEVSFTKPCNNSPLCMSELIQSCKVVEFSPDIDLGTISGIKCRRGLLYLLDGHSNRIIVATMDGKFIRYIGHAGRAFGEYISIHSYDVNVSNGEVVIYDISGGAVLTYSEDGTFLRSYNLDTAIETYKDISVLSNGNILCYYPGWRSDNTRRGVWMVDKDGVYLKQLVTINPEIKYCVYRGSGAYFFRLNDTTVSLMGTEGDDNVYHFDDDGSVEIAYTFDFGVIIPERVIKQDPAVTGCSQEAYSKNSYFENESIIVMDTEYRNSEMTILYDKPTKKLYTIRKPGDVIPDKRVVTLGYCGIENYCVVTFTPPSKEWCFDKFKYLPDNIENPLLEIIYFKR